MSLESNKIWNVMNDLEMTTSKICSAREIIDSVAEAIQKSDYNKAETLAMAAYEFLGYYLDEFDEKFKLAWQETVVKQKEENDYGMKPWGHSDLEYLSQNKEPLTCDKNDQSPECQDAWNSFWDGYQGSTVSSVQYTEEELNAMCDKAKEDEKHSEHYYDYTRNDLNRPNPFKKEESKKWIIPVEMDGPSGEYFIMLPDDLLEEANLKEGDQINWVDNKDGSYSFSKYPKTYDDMISEGFTMTADGFWIKE